MESPGGPERLQQTVIVETLLLTGCLEVEVSQGRQNYMLSWIVLASVFVIAHNCPQ
jgi:hypothetical protein